MNDAGSILLCYGLVLGGMAAYAWRVVSRGRRLGREVPEQDKPWT